MQQKIRLIILQLSIIISLSLIFGVLGFLYSFFGLFDNTPNTVSLEPFRLLTVQEIGGHFLFGIIVSIPLRSIKASILIGLMALTIDSDHLLNIVGFHIQARIDHSIPFAIISSILMAFIADKIYFKVKQQNNKNVVSWQSASQIYKKNNNNNRSFIFFLFISLSAFLSHMAYDVFVSNEAKFPLLAPFSFAEFVIPQGYGLPIEISGCLVTILAYLYCVVGIRTKSHLSFGLPT